MHCSARVQAKNHIVHAPCHVTLAQEVKSNHIIGINPRPRLAYSLYHFQGVMVMIKGSLLVSLPIIKRFGRKFFRNARKSVIFAQFFGRPGKPLDGYV